MLPDGGVMVTRTLSDESCMHGACETRRALPRLASVGARNAHAAERRSEATTILGVIASNLRLERFHTS